MPRICLFIATSLDGFIADQAGGVDWLFTDDDYGYTPFFEGIGALFMGRKTYDQVLSFGEWPYGDKPTFVFTRQSLLHVDRLPVQFLSLQGAAQIQALCQQFDHDLWLVGGAEMIHQFRRWDLIDEYILSIHPILLGQGIPLFQSQAPRSELQLISSISFPSGLIQSTYGVETSGSP